MREVDYARSLFRYIDMKSPPVNIQRLLELLDVKLMYEDFEQLNGIALKSPKSKLIVVNKNLPETRMRFTIAHELGHIIMPHRKKYYLCVPGKNRLMERSANKFAAEILMPQPMVKYLWNKFKHNPEHRIEAMAHALKVSKAALFPRLRELGFIYK